MTPSKLFRSSLAAVVLLAVSAGPLSLPLAAQPNESALFSPDSPVYELLRFVRLDAGLSVPWSSRSLSARDIRRQLEPVEEGSLSAAGRRALDEIGRLISAEPIYESDGERFAFDVSPTLTLEGYFNSADEQDQWRHDFRRRPPLLSLPAEVWVGEHVYGRVDLDLRHAKFATVELDRLANVPLATEEIDFMFPYRGYAAASGEHLFAQLGRDQLRWGSGRTGVLNLSDEPDYYDFLRFGFGVERFRYTRVMVYLDPWVTGLERQIAGEEEASGPKRESAKTMYLNRFEFDLPGALQIAVVEGMLYVDAEPDIRLMNPLSILHNYFELERGSALLGLEANWSPWRRVNLYGEFALMQISTPFKASDIADSFGLLGGVEGVLPAGEGYLSGYAELAYTNPWYAIREKPVRSWHWRRRIVPSFGDLGGTIDTVPIGYAYGPDSLVFGAGAGYRRPGAYRMDIDLTYGLFGEQAIDTEYEQNPEAAALRTPSGTVEHRLIVELSGERQLAGALAPIGSLPDRSELSVGVRTAFLGARNFENEPGERFFDFQLSPFIQLRF